MRKCCRVIRRGLGRIEEIGGGVQGVDAFVYMVFVGEEGRAFMRRGLLGKERWILNESEVLCSLDLEAVEYCCAIVVDGP